MAADASTGSFFWCPYGTNPELLKYEVPEYTRTVHAALGSADESAVEDPDAPRCFNCGSMEHILNDCPERRNRELIALTRQLYDFFKGASSGPRRRIHEVAEWKKQRLEWLQTFEPGRVMGRELRDALAIPDGDVGEYVPWLRNIADFGYPTGWVAAEDPRVRIWRRIVGTEQASNTDSDEDDLEFSVYGETDETLVLPSRTGLEPQESADAANTHSGASEDSSAIEEGGLPDSPAPVRRWVSYPESYFSNSWLLVYSPPPPRPDPDPLDILMTDYDTTVHECAPWADFAQYAMPFLQTTSLAQPPPPSGSPPPLPPAPADCPPPPSSSPPPRPPPPPSSQPATPCGLQSLTRAPLLLQPQSLTKSKLVSSNGLDDPESDMDLSDSD
ncbi:zf-CCHC and PSP domain-containing protein [Phanerochaete sordida]|uniref:Zf-CCHC and PSP domain-containing protein n=1 Tax=Phanerochaete sordida TaxID=48140 RepID=A0A9P3GI76_9APHY|nr:zf-CCHC and PSP domain-containing protein [Phanerochaete sordida]